MCYINGMRKDARIEPGVLPLFRLASGFWLVLSALSLFGSVVNLQASVSPWAPINVFIALFLLLYLSSGRLQHRLGQWYLPVALLVASVGPIMAQWLDMAWIVNRGLSSVPAITIGSLNNLFFPLFVTMIFISVQYGFWAVLAFTLGTVALQVALAGSLFSLTDTQLSSAFAQYTGQPIIAGLTPVDIMVRTIFERIFLFPVVGFLVARVSTGQKNDRRELAEKNIELGRYATTVEQLTISHERNRLARDLHDTLAHTLSAVSVQLEALNAQFDSDTAGARETLRRTRELTRNGLQEVRRALNALRASPLEDLGLALAIRQQVESMAERTGMEIALDMTDDLDGLRPVVERSLYRITGEALFNADRHANTQHMTVSLLRDEHDLQLTVSDDGLGFDPEAVSGDGQYGLIGMRERAKLCNGQLIIDSGSGQGTTVRLTVKE